MNAKLKKVSLTILVIIAAIVVIYLAVNNLLVKEAPKATAVEASQTTQESTENKDNKVVTAINDLLQIADGEPVLGDKNAPVTFIEYASLSCHHCANFHKTAFPQLKREFIDSGKVKFVYRDFPLNKPALDAAVIALCKYEKEKDDDKYFSFIKSLFRTQESWAFTEDFALKLQTIAQLDGLNAQEFENCFGNIDLQKEILIHRQKAAENLRISSTPTFFINGKMLSGYGSFDEIRNIINQELK